jgi:hypothetical protein
VIAFSPFAGAWATVVVWPRTKLTVSFGAMLALSMLWATTLLGAVFAIATGEAAKRGPMLGRVLAVRSTESPKGRRSEGAWSRTV